MQKIPTVLQRDTEVLRWVLPLVNDECRWVFRDEGVVATRKWDGTCVLIQQDFHDTRRIWTRREVKPGKLPPTNFETVEYDEVTGKTVGWEPYQQSGFARFVDEAVEAMYDAQFDLSPGTYELIGPKINGNPEGWDMHWLIRHGIHIIDDQVDRSAVSLLVQSVAELPFEGVVFYHPDGRMAKLKRRDINPHNRSNP